MPTCASIGKPVLSFIAICVKLDVNTLLSLLAFVLELVINHISWRYRKLMDACVCVGAIVGGDYKEHKIVVGNYYLEMDGL